MGREQEEGEVSIHRFSILNKVLVLARAVGVQKFALNGLKGSGRSLETAEEHGCVPDEAL